VSEECLCFSRYYSLVLFKKKSCIGCILSKTVILKYPSRSITYNCKSTEVTSVQTGEISPSSIFNSCCIRRLEDVNWRDVGVLFPWRKNKYNLKSNRSTRSEIFLINRIFKLNTFKKLSELLVMMFIRISIFLVNKTSHCYFFLKEYFPFQYTCLMATNKLFIQDWILHLICPIV
jgi:hypothetical protein